MAATSYYAEDNLELQILTKEYVSELAEIWSRIFNREMCHNNLDKLKEHARKFYKDLVTESLEREQEIWKEIEELKNEAENLSRLLKTDINLPCYNTSDKPLLDVQSEMDRSLMELRERLRQRREQIYELLLEQEALCEELGESPRPLPADPLPTQADIDEFRAHLDCLREERVRRMNKLCTMRREIRNFLNILETKVANDTEDRLLNVRDLKLNEDTFNALELMHKRYGELVQEVHDGIEVIRKKLDTLWDRLSTSPATRNKFRKYTEYTHRTYDALYGELQRCEALKSQNIKLYVQQIRNEIREWWDKTLKSEAQRNSFTNFNSTCYTDDLLELHEMELEDLKLYYESNKEIFDLYADRRILWERMIALDAKASEPGRYNNRGGQLLREEKERKTLASKLPKIEKQITELVMKYESHENTPFLVNGENILEVMAQEWEQRRQEKEQLTSARKHQGLTPGPKTANSALRTPMSLKNASSVSILRKTPSTTSLSCVRMPMSTSSKRKLAATEKNNPAAKRSLMYSPSVTGKLKNGGVSTPSTLKSSILKPQMKRAPHRVIATTIRRCSGRLSAGAKKRRSMDKSNKFKVPKIVFSQSNEDEDAVASSSRNCLDDTYNSFEPAGRSSIIESGSTDAARKKRLREKLAAGVADQNARQSQFSKIRTVHTPSKPKVHGVSLQNQRTPPAHPPYSPSSVSILSSGRRKLTTKNLPIII